MIKEFEKWWIHYSWPEEYEYTIAGYIAAKAAFLAGWEARGVRDAQIVHDTEMSCMTAKCPEYHDRDCLDKLTVFCAEHFIRIDRAIKETE